MLKVALTYNLKKQKGKELPGDYFSEFDSQQTIDAIAQALRAGGNEVFLVEAQPSLLDWFKNNQVDIVFNIAEGFWGCGREAQIPAILDFLNIRYTGSGVLSMALAMDKTMAKRIFVQRAIPTPKFQLFERAEESLNEDLRFPLIVKPNCEGSAKGIHASSLVKDRAELCAEVNRVKSIYHQDVLVEEFIEGTELTVGIVGNEKPLILPILEIDFSKCREKGEHFYSWEVKEYQGVDSRYPDPEFFCPGRLSPAQQNAVEKVALAAHRALGCWDISRVDIRLNSDSCPYVLEVNPLPGLDPQESNLTRMAEASNISYTGLINKILESALNRHQIADTFNGAAVSIKES